MGVNLWDKLWLPLLIGVAIQIIVTALCFLSVRLWNYLMQQIMTETTVGESARDQPLPESAAAAHANGVPDLEMGNGYGPAEGGQSTTELEVELRIVNGGEGIEHFSDQEAHTPVIKFAVTTPKTQVTKDAATGALARPVEMDVPHSQQEEVSSWSRRNGQCFIPFNLCLVNFRLLNEAPAEKGCSCRP